MRQTRIYYIMVFGLLSFGPCSGRMDFFISSKQNLNHCHIFNLQNYMKFINSQLNKTEINTRLYEPGLNLTLDQI